VPKQQSKQRSKQDVSSTGQNLAENTVETRLQELLEKQKYRQALEEVKKIQRTHPDIELSIKESEIWLLRGKQEFQKQDLKHAEKSFARAIELGQEGEAHYWLARCLLELNQLDTAIDLLRDAFEGEQLPKDYSICYLKVLLLKGDTATVERLINQSSKRFSAAQLRWVKGVLALKNGEPQAALTSFEKIKQPLTPGDLPVAWIVYAQQLSENWDAAANTLKLRLSTITLSRPKYFEHPILERLVIFQQAKTGEPPLKLENLEGADKAIQEALMALIILQLIDDDNHHEAAHVLLQMHRYCIRSPELESLRPLLLSLAGQQALQQGQLNCTELFWQQVLTEQPFNLQLAVNLLEVLEANDSDSERQRLITRILRWLEQESKQNPQEWPIQRLKLTQAHLHCRLADAHMALSHGRAALGSVQQAERICPTSPEVLGRKGLITAAEGNFEEAIPLLTQALEGGCRYQEVYSVLLNCWEEQENKQAYNEARRRFGKNFGDVILETEVETLPWVDALSTQDYSLFSRLVQEKDKDNPAMHACRIFVKSVKSPPNSGGRVSLNQTTSTQEWDTLVEKLSNEEKIPVLQAIAISINLFAKREKGIAALTNKYIKKLFELGGELPEARVTHLVVLAITQKNLTKVEAPLRSYLDSMPQPGNALANIQLKARRFGSITTLTPAIEEALRREPQNPLLLLAKATTYPVDTSNYEKFKQEGFELARRLQDAKALQAFREEQAFFSAREAQRVMPTAEEFENLDFSKLDELLERMIRKLVGSKLSEAEMEIMREELKKKLFGNMPDFFEDDDDYDDYDDDDDDYEIEIDLDFILGKSSSNSKKKKGRKRGFQELF
jgi:tetratricopeptide (TPR) repeat protein